MDSQNRKKLGEIIGEFLVIERQQTLAERAGRTFITEFLQKHGPVQFKASSYWEDKLKAGDEDALAEALMDESENVIYDRLSEDDPTDGSGFLESIGWDESVEDIVAEVYLVDEKKRLSVHLGDIKATVEVLRFIDQFA